MKMLYNTVSLIDRSGNEMVFDIMTITLKEHLEDTIRWGCKLCEKYGADGFQINYCMAGYPRVEAVYYDANGNRIKSEIRTE
jgi:hypothetical protein